MAFYIESTDRPHKSRIVNEDVHVGELVAENGSDQFVRLDGASHSLDDFEGVADNHRAGDQIRDDEDATGGFVFESAENDRCSAGGDADRDRIKVKTPEDTGGNESAANITDGDIVGVIDTSAGTLSSTGEYKGRVVEEGYDDGESTPTTYNRTNDNFIPIGKAYRDEATDWDGTVRVEVRRDL